jgi:hypothetical protein
MPVWLGLPVWLWVVTLVVTVMVIGALVTLMLLASALSDTFSRIGSGLQSGSALSTPSPQDEAASTVAQFYSSLGEEDYLYATTFIGPPLADIVGVEELTARWEPLQKQAGKLESTRTLSAEQDREVLVTQELTFKKGNAYRVDLTLMQIAGEWKIVAARPDLVPQP